jgi:hypothetical protein
MPIRGSLADLSKALATALQFFRCILSHMEGMMIGHRETFQIVQGVIERIAVAVIDFMAQGNGAMRGFPNLLMQAAHAALAMGRVGDVVHPIRPARRGRVAAEHNSLKLNNLGFAVTHGSTSDKEGSGTSIISL